LSGLFHLEPMKFTVEPVQVTQYRVIADGMPVATLPTEADALACASRLTALVLEPLPVPPPPPPPPPEPVKRSVYKEPGSPDDAINRPICDRAKFSASRFNPPVDFHQGYNYERNVVLFDPQAPLIPVYPNWKPGEDAFAKTFERRRKVSNTPLISIRCPKNFMWTEGSKAGDDKLNGICIALGENPREVHHLYNFCMDAGVAYARVVQTWPKDAYAAYGRWIDGPLYYGSQGGSRLRAGTIRYGEFINGPAMHALGMIMVSRVRYRVQPSKPDGEECLSYDTPNTWVTPALQADSWESYGGTDPHRRAGTRYALPQDVSPAMRTQAGKWIAQTMYWYGAYDVDAGAGQPGFAFGIEPNMGQRPDLPKGTAIRAIDAFEAKHGFSPRVKNTDGFGSPRQRGGLTADHFAYLLDMDDIFRNARPVLDNRPGQWGGAGNPRVPLKGPILETF